MNHDPKPENLASNQMGFLARFLNDTEIDTRLLGMLGALALIWGGFHFYGVIFNNFGAFLTPRIFGISLFRLHLLGLWLLAWF